MSLQITAQHTDLTPELRSRVENAVDKLRKYFNGITNVQVILNSKEKLPLVELVFHVSAGSVLTAKARANDISSALDGSVNKMERQLKKHNQKLKGRKGARRPGHE